MAARGRKAIHRSSTASRDRTSLEGLHANRDRCGTRCHRPAWRGRLGNAFPAAAVVPRDNRADRGAAQRSRCGRHPRRGDSRRIEARHNSVDVGFRRRAVHFAGVVGRLRLAGSIRYRARASFLGAVAHIVARRSPIPVTLPSFTSPCRALRGFGNDIESLPRPLAPHRAPARRRRASRAAREYPVRPMCSHFRRRRALRQPAVRCAS